MKIAALDLSGLLHKWIEDDSRELRKIDLSDMAESWQSELRETAKASREEHGQTEEEMAANNSPDAVKIWVEGQAAKLLDIIRWARWQTLAPGPRGRRRAIGVDRAASRLVPASPPPGLSDRHKMRSYSANMSERHACTMASAPPVGPQSVKLQPTAATRELPGYML